MTRSRFDHGSLGIHQIDPRPHRQRVLACKIQIIQIASIVQFHCHIERCTRCLRQRLSQLRHLLGSLIAVERITCFGGQRENLIRDFGLGLIELGLRQLLSRRN